jgi:hypothetical protein
MSTQERIACANLNAMTTAALIPRRVGGRLRLTPRDRP